MDNVVKWRKKLLSPVNGSEWASEMVLNPAMIQDPVTGRIHMLFRATGPFKAAQIEGKPLPFPIFLGYAWSDDGVNFEFDLKKPALSPRLKYDKEEIYTLNVYGEKVVDYTNGCIEDPRLFFVEDVCYMTVACRMFPPGPYWDHDEPTQCAPSWALGEENPFSTQENPTVNVLFQVNLDALNAGRFEEAFSYVTELTDPAFGEDRDVFFFANKMMVCGEECYVMIHRPHHPDKYEGISEDRPSIMISAAKDFRDFAKGAAVKRMVLYSPTEDWQEEKVGGSTPPILLEDGRWLFNYHGKKDLVAGYGQSFMILKEQPDDLPAIDSLCNEIMVVNEEEFEAPAKFKTPCVFFTGMIPFEGDLLVSYGAADEHVGLMRLDFQKILKILENTAYGE